MTLGQALAVIDRQVTEGTWSYCVLYDLRASAYVPTPADVLQLVRRVGVLTTKRGPRGPVALVVADRTVSRMEQAYANLADLTALKVEVFTAIDDAEEWLDQNQ